MNSGDIKSFLQKLKRGNETEKVFRIWKNENTEETNTTTTKYENLLKNIKATTISIIMLFEADNSSHKCDNCKEDCNHIYDCKNINILECTKKTCIIKDEKNICSPPSCSKVKFNTTVCKKCEDKVVDCVRCFLENKNVETIFKPYVDETCDKPFKTAAKGPSGLLLIETNPIKVDIQIIHKIDGIINLITTKFPLKQVGETRIAFNLSKDFDENIINNTIVILNMLIPSLNLAIKNEKNNANIKRSNINIQRPSTETEFCGINTDTFLTQNITYTDNKLNIPIYGININGSELYIIKKIIMEILTIATYIAKENRILNILSNNMINEMISIWSLSQMSTKNMHKNISSKINREQVALNNIFSGFLPDYLTKLILKEFKHPDGVKEEIKNIYNKGECS